MTLLEIDYLGFFFLSKNCPKKILMCTLIVIWAIGTWIVFSTILKFPGRLKSSLQNWLTLGWHCAHSSPN